MKGKKILTLALGSLMALNIAGMALPVTASTAEAAVHHERGIEHNDEFNHAIRAEHKRHERKMHEIRQKYHSHSHRDEMQRELFRERERHEHRMREINRKYHHHQHINHHPSHEHHH